jgi:hypothetical protein
MLDNRYVVTVTRTAPNQAELTIADHGQIIHRHTVRLMCDAIFGPDADSVQNWQQIAIKFIDCRASGRPTT